MTGVNSGGQVCAASQNVLQEAEAVDLVTAFERAVETLAPEDAHQWNRNPIVGLGNDGTEYTFRVLNAGQVRYAFPFSLFEMKSEDSFTGCQTLTRPRPPCCC